MSFRVVIEILTKDNGIIALEKLLGFSIQAAHVKVSDINAHTSHIVVVNSFPYEMPEHALEEAAREIAARIRPTDIVAFLSGEKSGFASARLIPAAQFLENRQYAAAAVAAVKRNWAWDESDPIRVQILDTSEVFSVPASSDGRNFAVENAASL